MLNKISNNIKFLRQLKGLSQEQMADELKVTRSRIGGYEEGRNEPPIDLLIRLSKMPPKWEHRIFTSNPLKKF